MSTPLAQFTRLIERGFNNGDLTVLDEVVDAGCVEHQFERPGRPAPVVGTSGLVRIITELRSGGADFHLAIEDSSVTGDLVWARLRATGTDTGGQLGRTPTGRPFEITVIDIARFVDGLMVEHWGVPDRLGLLLQLGPFSFAPGPTTT